MSASDLSRDRLNDPPKPAGRAPRDVLRLRARPGWLVRWRTAWKTAELDRALAGGADPLATDTLLWRADQLTEPAQRLGYADVLERLVGEVSGEPPPEQPGPPIIRRDLIKANRSLLLVLAERLRGDDPIGLRGLAMVELLVGYGDSPLYRGPSPLQLKWKLLDVLAALDPASSWSASAS
jgi:hypothetical protein